MNARPDLLYPRDRFHENPKAVVRIVVNNHANEDWVYGIYPHYTEREIEDGILSRACECACCSCVRVEVLSKVEARVVDTVTARSLAEYRYVPDELTFHRI